MKKLKEKIFPYLLILPLVVVIFLFVIMPLTTSIADSFYKVNLTNKEKSEFIGTENYKALVEDKTTMKSVKNSMVYVVIAITLEMSVGLILALCLKDKFKGRGLVMAIIILPWALPGVINGIMWKLIYDPSIGLLNDFLLRLGIISQPQYWLSNPVFSKLFITIVHSWKVIPLVTIIILCQLQSIPDNLYQSARIDGAKGFKMFRKITLPLLKPALIITLTQSTIAAMQMYDEINVLTGLDLDTRSMLIQNNIITFKDMDIGRGMAFCILNTLIAIGISLIFLYIGRRNKDEKKDIS